VVYVGRQIGWQAGRSALSRTLLNSLSSSSLENSNADTVLVSIAPSMLPCENVMFCEMGYIVHPHHHLYSILSMVGVLV